MIRCRILCVAGVVLSAFLSTLASPAPAGQNPNIPDKLPRASVRQQVCLNGIWDFKSNAGRDWSRVTVPGSYAGDAQTWGGKHWDVWRYPPAWQGRGGTYRKMFDVPATLAGKNLTFYCGGARHHTHVILNGHEVGAFDEGYEPFEFDLGAALKAGKNELDVVIDDTGNDLFEDALVSLRGMQGDTYLKAYGPVRITDDAFVQTSVAKGAISYQIPVRNYLASDLRFFIRNYIVDSAGKVVKTFDGGWQTVPASSTAQYTCSSPWTDPHLWSTYDPYLYHLNTVLYDVAGKPLDWKDLRFGFREITWKGPHLFLNGHELFLYGDGRHSQGDIESTRAYYEALCKEMKSLGVDFMRLHTNTKDQTLYDVADEQGILLESEASHFFRLPSQDRAKQHMTRLILSQRNHPSVLVWSVSNELRWQHVAEPGYLIDLAHDLDPSRPAFASDFSQFSVLGDILGHHYDTMQVFDEWEKFGPGKPMIWDELGDIWQHDRKLANGSAGVEVSAQDYASGIWPDGHDQIASALAFIRDGKTFAGELHRVNVAEPWDFSENFFRWLPINENRGMQPTWSALEGPGLKAKYIGSCSVATNVWDPVLPVFEPNPAYYICAKEMRPVIFFDKVPQASFFAGGTIVVNTKLYYNDLRPADAISCRVESLDGKVLSQRLLPLAVNTGDVKDNVALTFAAPRVKTATKVQLVRQFFCRGEAGYQDIGQAATLYPSYALKDLLRHEGSRILVVRASESNGSQIAQYAQNGGRVLRIDAPAASAATNVSLHAFLPLNGSRHRVLDGLDQASFAYWKPGLPSELPAVPTTGVNMHAILLGDKNGDRLAMTETYIGRGVIIDTTLPIIDSVQTEPAAGWLLRNILKYLGAYRSPNQLGRTFFAGADQTASVFASAGADLKRISAISVPELKPNDVLILDGAASDFAAPPSASTIANTQSFVRAGGRVFVYRIAAQCVSAFSSLVGRDIRLTDPFLEERSHCVKAAVSWARKDTPPDLVEYYDDILIPQPFEPNYDPLISGIANRDLTWGGATMFDQGVEIAGVDPVRASSDHSILISNWRNDWSRPAHDLYAEYTNGVRDMRQADWFINRDSVVLKINLGKGCFVISQLDFSAGGDPGKRVLCQLLTGLGCSLGGKNCIPADSQTFDQTSQSDQLARFAKTNGIWPPAQRIYYGIPTPMPDELASWK